MLLNDFNSTLVRLKLRYKSQQYYRLPLFQFYISTIKATNKRTEQCSITIFQFYISTIKAIQIKGQSNVA